MHDETELKKNLLTYLLLAGFGLSLVAMVVHLRGYPFPGNQEGYMPTQPIAFSHKLHAGTLEMNCLYCHSSAEKGPHAGFPPSSLCMNCHKIVHASWQVTRTEVEKARVEKWDGRYPQMWLGTGGTGMMGPNLLFQVPAVEKPSSPPAPMVSR